MKNNMQSDLYDITMWKERIFSIIFSSICLIALFPYIVSIIHVMKDGLYFNFFSYTLNYILCFVVLFSRSWDIKIRTFLGLIAFYILAITGIYTVGPIGSGRLWLFSLSILASLFLGVKAGTATVLLNGLILIITGLLMTRDFFPWQSDGPGVSAWRITSVTFMFLNTILTIGTSLLSKAQGKALKKEKRMSQEIKESHSFLNQSLESSSIATYIIDLNHNITHCNNSWLKMTGKKKEDILGTDNHWLSLHKTPALMLADYLVKNTDIADYPEGVYQSSLHRGSLEGEFTISSGDAEEKHYFRTATPIIDLNGNLMGAIENIVDMTRMKNLENRLIQSQKMESIGRLAGGVAHDYNNISSIIIGYSELAMAETDKSLPIYEDLKEIYSAAEKSAKITKQLLAFARQQTISPVPLDLNKEVDNSLKMLRRLIGEDIQIEWLPGKKSSKVLLDPTQLDQILSNLCINARDAIEDVGTITIETDMLEVDKHYRSEHLEVEKGTYVMIALTDNGIGMDRDKQEKIFEPFFSTKGEQGTGLGLATVYGIIKQNGGFINVYSEKGKGTTFKLFFPSCSPTCTEPKIISKEKRSPAGELSILLVEDDKAILKMEKKILEKLGYDVTPCHTPGEALTLAENREEKIDLLITDVVMPGMNGKVLSEKIRLSHEETKVLYTSGYTANVIVKKGLLEKDVEFIAKPFSARDFSTRISGLFS